MELKFELPLINQILVCCDGASRGNPGSAGFGFVCRNYEGAFLYAEARGLGITTNFIAELLAIISTAEWVIQEEVEDLTINIDSTSAVKAFLSVDSLAKRGAGMIRGEVQQFLVKPSFHKALEFPGITYYRFH
ncbi:uncharacterized protein LOC113294859 [Papaver somniferum]|uniref:uncharacterized protein LOC113294859 n=1 Tax=Papaver somniferum TaxID=3469 RepID=UPI000E6FD4A0|nr:uncharacterized protein LOC113294859 [Papaver somniferum]